MSVNPISTWNFDSGMNSSRSSTNIELATINNSSINTFSDIPQTQTSADMTSWINLDQFFSNHPHTVPDTQHASYGFDTLPPDMMDFSASSATQESLLTSDLISPQSMKGRIQRPPTAASMDYDNSPEKVTLTIYNPNSETVECLTRIAMTNKSGFRLERS